MVCFDDDIPDVVFDRVEVLKPEDGSADRLFRLFVDLGDGDVDFLPQVVVPDQAFHAFHDLLCVVFAGGCCGFFNVLVNVALRYTGLLDRVRTKVQAEEGGNAVCIRYCHGRGRLRCLASVCKLDRIAAAHVHQDNVVALLEQGLARSVGAFIRCSVRAGLAVRMVDVLCGGERELNAFKEGVVGIFELVVLAVSDQDFSGL